MKLGGPPNPYRASRPIASGPPVQAGPVQQAPVQSQGPLGRPSEAAAKTPARPAPGTEDPWLSVSLGRVLSFAAGKLERGDRLSQPRSDAPGAHRTANSPALELGAYEGRGTMSAPEAHLDVGSAHPLYGRYLEQWLGQKSEAPQGKRLLLMLRERLGEMKQAARRGV
jgi:hypothetical protein